MLEVGIDVSKEKSIVAAITEAGELIMNVAEYQHNEKEMNELIKRIRSYSWL